MNDTPRPSQRICPHCSAVTWAGARDCWICGMPVEESWRKLDPAEMPTAVSAQQSSLATASSRQAGSRANYQFGLSTLLLFVTMSAIVCSITVIAPGLGVVVGLMVMGGFIGVMRRSAKAIA